MKAIYSWQAAKLDEQEIWPSLGTPEHQRRHHGAGQMHHVPTQLK